jgi:hypothetical protein
MGPVERRIVRFMEHVLLVPEGQDLFFGSREAEFLFKRIEFH